MKVYNNLLELIGFIILMPGFAVFVWDYLQGHVSVFSVALIVFGLAVLVLGATRAKRAR
jgi:hypothetical protein